MWCKALLVMFLLCTLLACCSLGQSPAQHMLRESAVRALEANMHELSARSRFRGEMSNEMSDDESEPAPAASPAPVVVRQGPRRHAGKPAPGKRQRVTPFQAKRVAAAQDWRCGCGCVDPADPQRRGYALDATYEVDHRIPIRFGGAHDPSNWVAVLRSHHQIKSAAESSEHARRRR